MSVFLHVKVSFDSLRFAFVEVEPVGVPFVEDSGANLATETLVRHLKAWGVHCDVDEDKLQQALKITRKIKSGATA